MTNWPEFIEWTLENQKSLQLGNLPMMKEEQREFLEKSIKVSSFSQVRRMREILQHLERTILDSSSFQQNLQNLDELVSLLSGLDNAKNFCKIGGIYFLFKYALSSRVDTKIRNMCFIVMIDCCSNNSFVQNFLIRFDFWRILDVVEDTQDW